MKRILDKLRNPVVMGQFRHFLSILGGGLVTRGWVVASDWELYTGIFVALVSLLLSATAPEKTETKGN